MRLLAAVAVAVVLSGCATFNREADTKRMDKPLVDRCTKTVREAKMCQNAREAALEFINKLAIEDQVCIDGKQTIKEPMVGCKVRAFVSSAGKEGVKLDIREAPGGSKFVVGSSWWFAEEALADVELHAQGFLLPEEMAAEEK